MHIQSTNLVRMSLPLLTHADAEIRRQVYDLLVCAYGGGVGASLRRLAQDPDLQVRRRAQLALEGAFVALEPAAAALDEVVVHVLSLGTLRVCAGGAWLDPRDWSPEDGGRAGWQKVQGAFAYLLHCGAHGATRAALVDAVWGGPTSPSSLSRTLTTLRGALARAAGEAFAERALICVGDTCRLDPLRFETDAHVFERVFALAAEREEAEGLAAAAPLYAQALELYGGPYMGDVLPGSGWMLPRRELLASYYVLAAERLAEDAYERGDDRRCVQLCLQVLDAEPAADDLVTWLLRAYARLGRHAELEFVYQSYLRVTGIKPADPQSEADPVVQAYAAVTRSRAVNE